MHIATITIKFTFHLDGLIKIVITGVQGRGGRRTHSTKAKSLLCVIGRIFEIFVIVYVTLVRHGQNRAGFPNGIPQSKCGKTQQ